MLVTVAPGRSVTVPAVPGFERIGEVLQPMFQHRVVGPGETVEIAAEEVELLRVNGFITDPDAPASEQVIGQSGATAA